MAQHLSRGYSTKCGTAPGRPRGPWLQALAAATLSVCCRSEPQASAEPSPTPRQAEERLTPGAGTPPDPELTPSSPQQPREVSIIELLASPERFRGQLVRLIGFVTLESEGTAVYLHEEDYMRTITRNAVWLDVARSDSPRLARPAYAIIEGQFDPARQGHMGMFSGTLTRVSRITPWPGRQAPGLQGQPLLPQRQAP
jgi:hypothetical protein